MSAEPIYKLQPNRTIQLRGCDDRGAAAALHSASASAFTISGRALGPLPADAKLGLNITGVGYWQTPGKRLVVRIKL